MNESQELTSTQMDKIVSDVWDTVSDYPLPADDPSFYGVKNEVRSYLQVAVKAPFFFALELGEDYYTRPHRVGQDTIHHEVLFVLGVGDDIRRVAI